MMMQISFIIICSLLGDVFAANPKPITTCIKDMTVIYNQELQVDDTSIRRVYTLCPKTVFTPGIANPKNGNIEGGQTPLTCKSNCLIKCGSNGSSSNDCTIDGTGTFGIFQVAYNLYPNRPKTTKDVVYQGITIDFFVSSGQIPILAAAFFGDVKFIDCVWSNNSADPLFVVSELVSESARSAALDGTPGEPPGFVWKAAPKTGSEGDNRNRGLLENEEGTLEKASTAIENANPQRTLRASDLTQDENSKIQMDGNRVLQTTGGFTVTFQDCVFDFNDPVRNAKQQGGLSLLRFEGSKFQGVDGAVAEYLGNIQGRIINCRFKDNVFNFNNDAAVYRSIIDFYSLGNLVMRQNCFLNSPVKNYGVVTVQRGAAITNDRNFVGFKQSTLKCPFIALLNTDYRQIGCGTPAASATCNAADVAPAPTPPGLCFPGDATCHVQGRGKVMMKDLELGDHVLVDGGDFEPIYSFGHRDDVLENDFLRLETSHGSLEISKTHMVFVEGGRSVPASLVKVGDKLQIHDGELVAVKAIGASKKRGAFAPFTASGTLVVNGVKASSFVAFQESETLKIGGRFDTKLSFQFLAHAFESPHRLWCQYISPCKQEKYTTDGVSRWVAAPLNFSLWYFEQHAIVMFLLGIPLTCILLCIAYPFSSLTILGTMLMVGHLRKSHCKTL